MSFNSSLTQSSPKGKLKTPHWTEKKKKILRNRFHTADKQRRGISFTLNSWLDSSITSWESQMASIIVSYTVLFATTPANTKLTAGCNFHFLSSFLLFGMTVFSFTVSLHAYMFGFSVVFTVCWSPSYISMHCVIKVNEYQSKGVVGFAAPGTKMVKSDHVEIKLRFLKLHLWQSSCCYFHATDMDVMLKPTQLLLKSL